MIMKQEKDYTGTIEYHLEVCDECICECPIKQEAYKKGKRFYGDWDDCKCKDLEELKKAVEK